eukprot:365693-Chlamydomonas_euryale.AAC.21
MHVLIQCAWCRHEQQMRAWPAWRHASGMLRRMQGGRFSFKPASAKSRVHHGKCMSGLLRDYAVDVYNRAHMHGHYLTSKWGGRAVLRVTCPRTWVYLTSP